MIKYSVKTMVSSMRSDLKPSGSEEGPSYKFKNKYMVRSSQVLSEKFNRDFTWKFFATSCG